MKTLVPAIYHAILFAFAVSEIKAQVDQSSFAIYAKMDNDYFTGTDLYYTNGVEVGTLFQPKSLTKNKYYHITLSQDIYTPSSLSDKNLRLNDYPYAGLLMLQAGKTRYDQKKGYRFQQYADIGIMGPNAKGEQMQTWFHKLIDDELPQGWDHQVSTKVIINYGNLYERRLLKVGNHMEATAGAGAFLGTLKSGFDLGIRNRFGWLRSYFQSPFENRKRALELFSDVHFMYLINDGILSTKNKDGVPVVDESFVNNAQWKVTVGILIHLPKAQLLCSLSKLNEPFTGAANHRYGTVGFIVFI